MILFINPLQADIHLFIVEGNVSEKQLIIPRGDDFSTFPEMIMETLDENQIEEIWVICGPGAFTRMRIIILCLNTIAMTKKIKIKGCHFFDLITEGIPIIQVNNTEYIIKETNGNLAYKNYEEIPQGKYSGYLLKNDFTEGKVFIQYTESWKDIYQLFHSMADEDALSPIYFKAPHITIGSKKNTSPS